MALLRVEGLLFLLLFILTYNYGDTTSCMCDLTSTKASQTANCSFALDANNNTVNMTGCSCIDSSNTMFVNATVTTMYCIYVPTTTTGSTTTQAGSTTNCTDANNNGVCDYLEYAASLRCYNETMTSSMSNISWTICKIVAIASHFFMVLVAAAFFFEATFAESMVHGKPKKNGCLPAVLNYILPIIIAAIPTGVTFYFQQKNYGTTYMHCFAVLTQDMMWGFIIPVWIMICAATLQSQLACLACDMTTKEQDQAQCYWAKKSAKYLTIVAFLLLSIWLTIMHAGDEQLFYLFILAIILCIIFGPVVFLAHTSCHVNTCRKWGKPSGLKKIYMLCPERPIEKQIIYEEKIVYVDKPVEKRPFDPMSPANPANPYNPGNPNNPVGLYYRDHIHHRRDYDSCDDEINSEDTPLLKDKTRRRMTNKRMPSLRMILVALISSLGGSFHFGFQLTLTNSSQEAFVAFLNKTLATHVDGGMTENSLKNVWSFVVAILFLGALMGSFLISLTGDFVGRKRGLYISIGLGMLSGGLSIVSYFIPSFAVYVISRVTMGISVSMSLGLSALFLSEASPKECRGSIGMITGVCVQLGTVFGSVLAMPQLFGTENEWYLIYACEVAMMAIFFVMLPLLPESPGYLVKRAASDAAREAVKFFHICDDARAEDILMEIKEEQKRAKKQYGMLDILKKGSLRKKAGIGMVVTFAMSFSGIAVINAYAFDILEDTGLSSLGASLGNIGIALVSVFAIVIASTVVDKFGRRPLLLLAFIGCLFCNFIIFGLMFSFDKYGYSALGFCLIFVICVFIIFFAIGPGPLCYFINAELVGLSARSAAQSWASVVQMLSRFVLVAGYTPLKNKIDSFAYLALFVAPVAVSIVYLYFYLPETKNKNAAEVEEAMEKLPTIFSITHKKNSKVHPLEEKNPIEEFTHI